MINRTKALIKLGGAALQDESVLTEVVQAIRQLRRIGFEIIVVHGGGPAINSELQKKGISWSFHEGQRITTPEMMDSIEMVLSGTVNSRIVRALNVGGIPALGMSGTDGGLFRCRAAGEILGRVGQIEEVNADWVASATNLKGSPVPVIAPLGVGQDGEVYNINADWAATRLATALQVDQLLFLTDTAGVLDSTQTLIPQLSEDEIEDLEDLGVVQGGMLTKTRAVRYALRNGVELVRILRAKDAVYGVWSEDYGTNCRRQINPLSTVLMKEKSLHV